MPQLVRGLRAILGISEAQGGGGDWGERVRPEEPPPPKPLVPRTTAEDEADALEETRLAIEHIVIPRNEPVELLPRVPAVLQLQVRA